MNDKLGKYGNNFMKMKFDLDDLPLIKILKLRKLTIVVKSVFQKDRKYYPQVVLDECLCEL